MNREEAKELWAELHREEIKALSRQLADDRARIHNERLERRGLW